MNPLLDVKALNVTFLTTGGPARAVEDVTFGIYPDETLALIGETGCGKSMTAHSLLGLAPSGANVSGQILFRGRDILSASEREKAEIRRREIALILQNPRMALNPVYPVRRTLLRSFRSGREIRRKKAVDGVLQALSTFGFENPGAVIDLYPHQLSGGMAQRILTAAAEFRDPSILIADEPTKGLDAELAEYVLGTLMAAAKSRKTSILLITHDLQAARRTSDRVAVMYAGQIVETSPAEDFFALPLHPYSRLLLGSLPENGFQPIKGMPPSLTDVPCGCRFHPRCPSAKEACRESTPRIKRVGEKEVRCILFS